MCSRGESCTPYTRHQAFYVLGALQDSLFVTVFPCNKLACVATVHTLSALRTCTALLQSILSKLVQPFEDFPGHAQRSCN